MPHLAFEQKVTSMKKISIVVTIVAVLLAAVMLLYGCTFRIQCAEESKMCSDGNILKTCVKLGENNNAWVQSEDCAAAGMICDGQTKTCVAGCTYSYTDQTGTMRSIGVSEGTAQCFNASILGSCTGSTIIITNCAVTGKSCSNDACIAPSNGSIYVSSSPTAAVRLNNVLRGNSPRNISLLPGTYSVNVSKSGYLDNVTSISVTSGANKNHNVILRNVTSVINNGSIYVTGTLGATVRLNNVVRGNIAINISLLPGTYSVNVSKSGYLDNVTSISVTSGVQKNHYVNLSLI